MQIVSGARDRTIKLWNTIGECKYTIGEPDGHTEWVSCVRFSPVTQNPIIVSAGWDRLVKVSSASRYQACAPDATAALSGGLHQVMLAHSSVCLFCIICLLCSKVRRVCAQSTGRVRQIEDKLF